MSNSTTVIAAVRHANNFAVSRLNAVREELVKNFSLDRITTSFSYDELMEAEAKATVYATLERIINNLEVRGNSVEEIHEMITEHLLNQILMGGSSLSSSATHNAMALISDKVTKEVYKTVANKY